MRCVKLSQGELDRGGGKLLNLRKSVPETIILFLTKKWEFNEIHKSCKTSLLGVRYNRKEFLRTVTRYRIWPDTILVLVTGTGILFTLFWFRLNLNRKSGTGISFSRSGSG